MKLVQFKLYMVHKLTIVCVFTNFAFYLGQISIKTLIPYLKINDGVIESIFKRFCTFDSEIFIKLVFSTESSIVQEQLLKKLLQLTCYSLQALAVTFEALRGSFDVLRMVQFSFLVLCLLCKFDLDLIKQRVQRPTQSILITNCYNDLQTVYLGQMMNLKSKLLKTKAEKQLYLMQIAIFSMLQIAFKCTIIQQSTMKDFQVSDIYQILKNNFSHCLTVLIQVSFLLAMNFNCCGILIFNLVISTTIDFVQQKTNCHSQQFEEQNLFQTMFQILVTLAFIGWIQQQIRNKNIKKINEFNNHLISDQFWPCNSSMVALITLDSEDAPCNFQEQLIKSYIRKIRQGQEFKFRQTYQLKLKILRYDQTYIKINSQSMSVQDFCKTLNVEIDGQISCFLTKNLNFCELGDGPSILQSQNPKNSTLLEQITKKDKFVELEFNQKYNIISAKIVKIEKQKCLQTIPIESKITDYLSIAAVDCKDAANLIPGIMFEQNKHIYPKLSIKKVNSENPTQNSAPNEKESKNRKTQFQFVERIQSQNSMLSFAELVDEQLKTSIIIAEQQSESKSDSHRLGTYVEFEIIDDSANDLIANESNASESNANDSNLNDVNSSECIMKRNSLKQESNLLNNSVDIMQVFDENSVSIDGANSPCSSARKQKKVPVHNDTEKLHKIIQLFANKEKIFNTLSDSNENFSKEQPSTNSLNLSSDLSLFFNKSVRSTYANQIKLIQLKEVLAYEIKQHSTDKVIGDKKRNQRMNASVSVRKSAYDKIFTNMHFEKIMKLQSQLKNNKMFMNMVIHDMRNPTNAIQFGVTETIQMLQNQKKKVESMKKMRKQTMGFINQQIKKIKIINKQMLKRSNSGNGKEKSYSVHSKSQDIEIGDSDHSIVLRGLIRGFQPIVFDESISAANKSQRRIRKQGFEFKEQERNENNCFSQSNVLAPKFNKQMFRGISGKNFFHNAPALLKHTSNPVLCYKDFMNYMDAGDSLIKDKHKQKIERQNNQNLMNYQAHYFGGNPLFLNILCNSLEKYSPNSESISILQVEIFEDQEQLESNSQIIQRNRSRSKEMKIIYNPPRRKQSHVPPIVDQISYVQENPQIEIPIIDNEQIERECDFQDTDEMLRKNLPRVSKVHKNEMQLINNQDFYLKMKKLLEKQVQNFEGDQDQFQEIKNTMERCHQLCGELFIRDRVVIAQPRLKNLISRASQCQIEAVPVVLAQLPQEAIERERAPPRLARRAHSRYDQVIEALDGRYDKKIQCDLGESDLCQENQALKQQNALLQEKQAKMYNLIIEQNAQNIELKNHVNKLQKQYVNQVSIIEMQENQLIEIEEQCVLETQFLVEVERFLQNAVFSATMLGNLINDMLDLAKFEAGTFKFHDDFFDLIEVIEQAFETVKYQASRKQISVRYQVLDHRNVQQGLIVRKNPSIYSISNSIDSESKPSVSKKSNDANLENNESHNPTFKSNSTVKVAGNEVKNMFYQLYGDKNRYLQIMLNFLSNSIHYTNKNGQISINLVLLEEQIIKPRKDAYSLIDIEDNIASKQLIEIEEIAIASKYLSNNTSDILNNSQSADKVSMKLLSNVSVENQSLNVSKIDLLSLPKLKSINEMSNLKNKSLQMIKNIKFESDRQQKPKFVKFRLEIADTGVGIKKEDLPKLFTDFTRLDQGMNNKGTGLGLSICKKMIEKMGGKVEVDSTFGVGTTFKVTLQTKCISQQKLKQESKNSDHSISISNNQSSLQANQISISESNNSEPIIRIRDNKKILSRGQSMNSVWMKNNELSNMLEDQSNSSLYLSSNQQSLNHVPSQSINLSNCNNSENNGAASNSCSNISKNSCISVMKIGDQLQQYPMTNPKNYKLSKNSSPNLLNYNLFKINEELSIGSVYDEQEEQEYSKRLNELLIQEEEKKSKICPPLYVFSQISEEPEFNIGNSEIQSASFHQSGIQKNDANYSIELSLQKNSQIESVSYEIIDSHEQQIKSQSQNERKNLIEINDLSHKSSNSNKNLFSSLAKKSLIKKQSSISLAQPQLDKIQKTEELKCLVANDCDFQLMQINIMLKKANVKVVEAINGLEALELVTQSQEKFDFVILDLNMPIMDGYDACKQIIDHYSDDNKLMGESDQQNEMKDKLDHIHSVHKQQQHKSEGQILMQSYQMLDLSNQVGKVPILVALSAHISDDIRNKCLSSGFNIILESPLTVKIIENEILKQVRIYKDMHNNLDSLIMQQIQQLGEDKSSSSSDVDSKQISKIPMLQSIKKMGSLQKVDEHSNSQQPSSPNDVDSEFSIQRQ